MIPIIILTFKRLHRQLTYQNIPESYRNNVTLVVQPQEESQAKEITKNVWVVSGDNIGVAKTIRDITYEWAVNRKENFWIMDDDLTFMENHENADGIQKTKMSTSTFYSMIENTEKWIKDDGIIHGALGTTWNPPEGKLPFLENSRMNGNRFYNGEKLSSVWNEIDWEGCDGAEDFYVNLQLLSKGFKNRVWYSYVISPGDTNSDGGCSTFRDIEFHNNSMKELQSKFPDIVALKEKIQKSGPWKGKPKLAATISWKMAFKKSQVSTLESFMG